MTRLANRIAYGEALAELGRRVPRVVVLDADLAKATQTDRFRQAFPERFFNAGIAEQNLMGLAAGMAATGLIPFVSTFAVFATMRGVEQFRNSIAYPNLNVKVVATHAGIENGPDGASHQSVEDLAIMRAIPNTTVIVPSDPITTKKAVEAVAQTYGPAYIRLGRAEMPFLYAEDFQFEIGKGAQLRDGYDLTIIAVGNMVEKALLAADELAKERIRARVIDLLTVKPLDEELILKAAQETRGIITVENHSILGGLGGAICELLSERYPARVLRVGLQDRFGGCGNPELLHEELGLSVDSIIAAAHRLLK